MTNPLDDRELRQYHDEGFVVRPAALTDTEVASLRDAVEIAVHVAARQARTGGTYHLDGKRFVDYENVTIQFEHQPGSNDIRVIETVHEYDGRLDRLLDDARITVPMQQLVASSSLALWTSKLNLKRPRIGSGFGWHQDSPYWMHDCGHVDRLPNVMVTLDAARRENGCFAAIRRSHARGILPGTSDGTQLGGFFTDPSCFDEADAVHFEVPAGSLIFFSPHVVHGSGPNGSKWPRRALILTYQPGGYPMLKNGRVRDITVPA